MASGIYLPCSFTYRLLLLQPVVSLIVHRFAPLVPGLLTGHFYCNVGKPAVLFGSVPVLHLRRDGNDHSGSQTDGRFSLLLIPALAGGADEKLPAAAFSVMDMPVVAAPRLKGDICQKYRAFSRLCQGIQIAAFSKFRSYLILQQFPALVQRIEQTGKPHIAAGMDQSADHFLLSVASLQRSFHMAS